MIFSYYSVVLFVPSKKNLMRLVINEKLRRINQAEFLEEIEKKVL